ncbi:ELMO/CED-12 family-domain-containing protein [Paraphysoderma sedebokerense]|nr:ELMO/CED-12 family-domain-containing protein [Paraphysoderma sedebokerense]
MPSLSITVAHEKQQVPVQIDPLLPFAQIIKDVVTFHLNIKGDPNAYCLRFLENDELVDEQKLRRKAKNGDVFKLVPSPMLEAKEFVEKLNNGDLAVQKMTIFSLQNRLKQKEFTNEFTLAGGVHAVMKVVKEASGNTLAYALSSLQNLMEHDNGWDIFDIPFITRLVTILVTENMVNICRPCTGIVIKLTNADSSSSGAVKCYGFDIVHQAMTATGASSVLPTLVQRLTASDFAVQVNSLILINTLFKHAINSSYRESFVRELDQLETRKAVLKLMATSSTEELNKELVEFQRLFIQDMHQRKKTPVTLETGSTQEKLIAEIFESAGLADHSVSIFRSIGFDSSNPKKELARVGQLGLELMHFFATKRKDAFQKWIQTQQTKPSERRCPFAKASVEVTEQLSEYWEISSGVTTITAFQPPLLHFEVVYSLFLQLFLRIYNELEPNALPDFTKLMNMLRSHLKYVLKLESTNVNLDAAKLEKDILEANLKIVRERHLKDLEEDDELMSKEAVRTLRGDLYKNSYNFIKQQRISCLLNGAWFAVFNKEKGGKMKNLFRYYKLSLNKKFLHYADFSEISETRPLLEMLTEKVDITNVTDILTGSSSPINHVNNKRSTVSDIPTNLCFSLMSSPETSVADFICTNSTQFSEWTDGFNMLFDRSISNKDTAEFITSLTDVQVRLSLLDVMAERWEIPNAMPEIPQFPSDVSFYYDNVAGIGVGN